MAGEYSWRMVSVGPSDVRPDDAFAVKIVAVMDPAGLYWSAYRGPSGLV